MSRRRATLLAVLAALLCVGCAPRMTKALPEEDKPSAVEVLPEDEPPAAEAMAEEPAPLREWWTVPVFAHGMGAVDGRMGTNSKDAFLANYAAGHRVFEVDFQLTADGRLVARHDWEQISYYNLEQTYVGVMDYDTFMHTPICYFYTPLDFEGVVALLREHPDICLVTDSKDTDEPTVRAQLREIARVIDAAGDPTLWERVVLQIYSEKMYDWAREETGATQFIFTLYQIADPDYDAIGAFCEERGIPVVATAWERLNKSTAEALHTHGLRYYVHPVNRVLDMIAMSWAADGYYSDYVKPEQFTAACSGTSRLYLAEENELDTQ